MHLPMNQAVVNHNPYVGIGDGADTRVTRVSFDGTANSPKIGHSEPDHLSVALAGTAAATGPNSVAEGHITNTIKDMGSFVIAYGEATFYAASTDSNEVEPHQFADVKIVVTGADVVCEKTIIESGQDGELNWQATTVEYVAIEFPGTLHATSNDLDPCNFCQNGPWRGQLCCELNQHRDRNGVRCPRIRPQQPGPHWHTRIIHRRSFLLCVRLIDCNRLSCSSCAVAHRS